MASPNAKTKEISNSDGPDTYGQLNQHPTRDDEHELEYVVGVSVDRNKKCRRTMEDAHSFIYDFGGLRGQGFFAVFDGHAGKHAAEWCGEHFHEYLLDSLRTSPSTPVPDLLNATFHRVDGKLSALAAEENTHSGCTAVVAFLRLEDDTGNAVGEAGGVGAPVQVKAGEGGGIVEEGEKYEEIAKNPEGKSAPPPPVVEINGPAEVKSAAKRTLYTANVGDARAVLSRKGKAVRLTYDHKGSDAQEAKRITDAGGFVMNNRVNGVLAVTRSLGDSSMKEFVVGSPYTTETTLGPDDDYLIVACDGLWDVCQDQEAVDIIKGLTSQDASQALLDHALQNFSSDNLSVLVVALKA